MHDTLEDDDSDADAEALLAAHWTDYRQQPTKDKSTRKTLVGGVGRARGGNSRKTSKIREEDKIAVSESAETPEAERAGRGAARQSVKGKAKGKGNGAAERLVSTKAVKAAKKAVAAHRPEAELERDSLSPQPVASRRVRPRPVVRPRRVASPEDGDESDSDVNEVATTNTFDRQSASFSPPPTISAPRRLPQTSLRDDRSRGVPMVEGALDQGGVDRGQLRVRGGEKDRGTYIDDVDRVRTEVS